MSTDSERPVALVTGAARRIGRAVALDLATAGLDVAVHHRDSVTDAADVVEDVVSRGVDGAAFAADLSDPAAARALAARVLERWGRVDVLVNNASTFVPTPLDTMSAAALDAELARMHAVHVAAPLALIHALLPGMRARGSGSVVNVGDACEVRAEHAAYAATKASLASLTRNLAHDLAPHVRVNMVAPGAILPPPGATASAVPRIVARVPMGRLGTVEEVAAAVRFLALGPGFVTGQVLAVDGGQHA